MSRQPNKLLTHGLPLVTLTLGGWLGIAYFMQGRIDVEDAKRKEVDLRAPVHKQRAKRFNLDEELTKLKEAQQQNYTNKKIERPKEWWEQGKEKQ